jgi:hypothetical protein
METSVSPWFLARAADADFDLFTLDDVDTAFGRAWRIMLAMS